MLFYVDWNSPASMYRCLLVKVTQLHPAAAQAEQAGLEAVCLSKSLRVTQTHTNTHCYTQSCSIEAVQFHL